MKTITQRSMTYLACLTLSMLFITESGAASFSMIPVIDYSARATLLVKNATHGDLVRVKEGFFSVTSKVLSPGEHIVIDPTLSNQLNSLSIERQMPDGTYSSIPLCPNGDYTYGMLVKVVDKKTSSSHIQCESDVLINGMLVSPD